MLPQYAGQLDGVLLQVNDLVAQNSLQLLLVSALSQPVACIGVGEGEKLGDGVGEGVGEELGSTLGIG